MSFYGADQYILQYDNELGPPWKNLQRYIQLSYPFLQIDKRIHTPMLFMGGTSDMNVPLLGGEQMYQALRSLNRPTELVVYPGQFRRPQVQGVLPARVGRQRCPAVARQHLERHEVQVHGVVEVGDEPPALQLPGTWDRSGSARRAVGCRLGHELARKFRCVGLAEDAQPGTAPAVTILQGALHERTRGRGHGGPWGGGQNWGGGPWGSFGDDSGNNRRNDDDRSGRGGRNSSHVRGWVEG